MFRRVVVGATWALGLMLPSLSLAAKDTVKIAVVSVEDVMKAAPEWQKAVDALGKSRTEKQTALENKQKELKERKEKLDAQKAVSINAAASAKEEELMRDAQMLTQEFMKAQQDLTEKERKLTDAMLSRVELIVRDLALEGDYDFVFENGPDATPNVLYSTKQTNLTPKVVEAYKKRFKDKPLTP